MHNITHLGEKLTFFCWNQKFTQKHLPEHTYEGNEMIWVTGLYLQRLYGWFCASRDKKPNGRRPGEQRRRHRPSKPVNGASFSVYEQNDRFFTNPSPPKPTSIQLLHTIWTPLATDYGRFMCLWCHLFISGVFHAISGVFFVVSFFGGCFLCVLSFFAAKSSITFHLSLPLQ